jgi:Skp family chaperone for outer membrane proteins
MDNLSLAMWKEPGMNRNLMTAAVAVVAAFAVGWACSNYTSSKGGVAVVDLDEIAKQLGRSEQMANTVQATAGTLSDRLVKAGNQLNAQLAKMKAGLGEMPSQEDAQKYLQTQRAAQLQFNQATQQVRNALDQTRVKLVADFRTETRPHAQKVAAEKGLHTVFTKNDAVVFAFDDAVDITDEVIALMKAEGLAAAPTAAPAQAAPASSAPEYQPEAPSQVVPASATAPAQETAAPAAGTTP